MTGLARTKGLERRTPLKPRAALQRRTPLQRHTPLDSRVTLATYTPLRSYTPLAPVSAKRAAANRKRRNVIAELWPGRPLCAVPWCVNWADDVHEILTRARGGSITDPANLAAVCRTCHDEITCEVPWAYDLGLLEHSWGDAA